MSENLVEVQSLWKIGGGYEVTAIIRSSFGEVKVEMATGMDTPEKAIEAARFKIQQMGEQVAAYLKEPETLK